MASLAFSQGAGRVALGVGTAGGGVVSVANPEGVDVIVTFCALDIGTPSTGASTIDVGIGTGATTSYDTLLDGQSGATAGVLTNGVNGGTNGKAHLLWPAASYLTASQASGAVAGIVGELICRYIIR